LFGALFLLLGASSPVFADDFTLWSTQPVGTATWGLFTPSLEDHFQEHQIALGGANLSRPMTFEDETSSPLFTANSISNAATGERGDVAVASEWDPLWRNATRIPATVIPEPSAATLLLGGVLLLWGRRPRSRRT
jgi:hypothetical protein